MIYQGEGPLNDPVLLQLLEDGQTQIAADWCEDHGLDMEAEWLREAGMLPCGAARDGLPPDLPNKERDCCLGRASAVLPSQGRGICWGAPGLPFTNFGDGRGEETGSFSQGTGRPGNGGCNPAWRYRYTPAGSLVISTPYVLGDSSLYW